jgi:hypothetical protein
MADESLKSHYRDIEAGESEMVRYREGLRQKLAEPRRSKIKIWMPLAATAAAALCAAWFFMPPTADFPQQTLDELQSFALTCTPDTLQRAGELVDQPNGFNRLNAMMLLTLTDTEAKAVPIAAQGIQEDPRSDYRSYYLEYLLDHADERRYNCQIVEDLMDRETDQLCQKLYRQLFRIACRSSD